MQIQPKFTLIVPIFKTEPFLEQCLESILNQTYQNFECIVISDNSPGSAINSTDKNSQYWTRSSFISTIKDMQLIEPKYQAGYIYDQVLGGDSQYRFQFIQSPNNIGVCLCRNLGIEKAKGKYIVLIDSDDYLEPDYLKSAFETVEANPNSIIYAPVKNLINNEVVAFSAGQKFFLEENNLANLLVAPTYTCTPVNYFWSLDTIKNQGIKFNQKQSGEDTIFMLDNLFANQSFDLKKNFVVSDSNYIYRQFDEQTTRTDDFQIKLFTETTKYIESKKSEFAKLGFKYQLLANLFVVRFSFYKARLENKNQFLKLYYGIVPKFLTIISTLIAKL
jgi:glycosyltransferase involved in cell wall biosynthesis